MPPGAEPGTVPTDLEQATGLERLEILGKMQGIDIFDMKPLPSDRVGMCNWLMASTSVLVMMLRSDGGIQEPSKNPLLSSPPAMNSNAAALVVRLIHMVFAGSWYAPAVPQTSFLMHLRPIHLGPSPTRISDPFPTDKHYPYPLVLPSDLDLALTYLRL